MGEHHRIKRCERRYLGHVEVRCPVRGGPRFFAAVQQDLALRRRYQERSAADLAAASERRDPEPLIFARDLAVDAVADLAQKRFTLVFHRPEIGTDLFYRRTLDGRCPDHFRCPADLLCDLAEGDAVLSDDNTGFLRLDQNLARLRVEEEIGYPCSLRHDRTDLQGSPFGVLENIRAYDDPLPEITRKDLDQVGLIGKLFWVVGIDDKLGPFKLDVRDCDPPGNNLVDLLLQILEFICNYHYKSVLKNVRLLSGQQGGPATRVLYVLRICLSLSRPP